MLENEIIASQRKSWDTYSKGWDKWDDIIVASILPVANKMIEVLELTGSEHILDVASGTGEPGIRMAPTLTSGRVTGCDLSEQMVIIANRKASEKGVNNYSSICCDATEMPFEDNTFDHVMCRFGIMFFPDMVKGVSEMRRVVKPGGKIILAVWGEPANNQFLTLLAGTAKMVLALPDPPPDSPGVFRCHLSGTTARVMTDAGLQKADEITFSGSSEFESEEVYWSFMSEVAGPVMDKIAKAPPEMQDKVKQQVLLNASKYISDGKLVTPWQTYIATGIK